MADPPAHVIFHLKEVKSGPCHSLLHSFIRYGYIFGLTISAKKDKWWYNLKINPNQCQNHLKLIYSSMPKQFHNIGPRSNMIKCIINDANLFFSSIERQNDVDTLDVIEVRRIQKTKSEKQSLNDIKNVH